MVRRTVPLFLLAALVLPASAAAKQLDVEGPLAVQGKGPVRAELRMAKPTEAKPVAFAARGGRIRVVDLAGDARVTCQGSGEATQRENGQRQRVFVCGGRGGRAKIHGSHFRLVGFALRYRVLIPAGVTGTLQGHFRTCTPGEEQSCRPTAEAGSGEAPGEPGERAKQRAERLKERAEQRRQRAKDRAKQDGGEEPAEADGDDVPTVEEVAEELAKSDD